MKHHVISIILALAALVLGLWILTPHLVQSWSGSSSPEVWASFGDMFGVISALFSGLAFLGVIYTVWLQSEELKLQRLELAQTRVELERSATAQENAFNAMQLQIKASAISAKLSVLSNLLDEEIDHLEKYHSTQLGSNNPGALTEIQIDRYLNKYETPEAQATNGPGEKCFILNMQTLKSLKRDLKKLYVEANEL